MTITTIAAKDVQPGDRIYNNTGYCEGAKWVKVVGVSGPDARGYVTLRTAVYNEVKHVREGIAVKRESAPALDCNCDQSGPVQCDQHGPRE